MVFSSRLSRSPPVETLQHAAARVIAAGEELGPRRRADRADVEPLEQRAVARQRVDVRRREIRVAVDAQIAPALIVGEDDDDVRLARLVIPPPSGYGNHIKSKAKSKLHP